jgi:3-oxoacyl-[acyl-carrier protein] reductase
LPERGINHPEKLLIFLLNMAQKHIIITGASRGIGFEAAQNLAERNVLVTAIARSEPGLSRLEKAGNGHILPLPMDITADDAGERLQHHLQNHSLKTDGIIHNAGLLINKPFYDLTDNDWEQQFRVNLMGPVRLTRALRSFFTGNAHILCISSMGGFQGSSKFPGLSAYSATKGALSILGECLAGELAETGVRCNTLCLGAVQTEMLAQAFPGFQAPVVAADMGSYLADFVLNGHKFYNGQVLPVTLGNPG